MAESNVGFFATLFFLAIQQFRLAWCNRMQIRRKVWIIVVLNAIVAIPTGGGGNKSRIGFATRMTPAVPELEGDPAS